jgi:hypothetical protein
MHKSVRYTRGYQTLQEAHWRLGFLSSIIICSITILHQILRYKRPNQYSKSSQDFPIPMLRLNWAYNEWNWCQYRHDPNQKPSSYQRKPHMTEFKIRCRTRWNLSEINRWNSLLLLAIEWANNRAYIDVRGSQNSHSFNRQKGPISPPQ